jgi:hypothetical protein
MEPFDGTQGRLLERLEHPVKFERLKLFAERLVNRIHRQPRMSVKPARSDARDPAHLTLDEHVSRRPCRSLQNRLDLPTMTWPLPTRRVIALKPRPGSLGSGTDIRRNHDWNKHSSGLCNAGFDGALKGG